MSADSIHIGLIPDGNRRYAQQRGIPVWQGHLLGKQKIEQFLDWCLEYPEIKRVTIYGLSTENLQRSPEEVGQLWSLYTEAINSFAQNPKVRDKQVQLRVLGDSEVWRPDLRDAVKHAIASTKQYSRLIMNIMIAYGSKYEISSAVKKVAKKPLETLDKFLLVQEPVDLVIRTGNQHRLSNFMLYQASYAEIWFSKKMWPAFSKKEFTEIMKWYFEQQKRYGK